MVLKCHMQHGQTAGHQTDKIQSGRESNIAADTKNSKSNKTNFFLHNGLVYLAEMFYEVLTGSCCSVVSK